MGGEKADQNDQNCADSHGKSAGGAPPQQGTGQRTGQRGAGIDMLHEDIGHVSSQHVPEYAAAHTGDHADEGQQEHTVIGRLGESSLHTDDGEDAKPKGIHHQHSQIIGTLMPGQQPLHGWKKHDGSCEQCRCSIDGIPKGGGGTNA